MCSDPHHRPPPPPRSGRLASSERLVLTASDGQEVAARLATTSAADAPAVVVLPDFRGLHPYYEALADGLAGAGVHALAIDHYGRSAGPGWRDADFDPMPHRQRATDAEGRADVDGALAFLDQRLGAGPRHVLGFCFGGRRALLQGDRDGLDGVIAFYARVALEGDGGSPTALAHAGALRAPVLGIFGGADPWIPVEEVAAFREACAASGTPCEIHVYDGAPHSFFDHEWVEHAGASADAWGRVLAFLDHTPPRSGRQRPA